ncbi:hypothetical protein [Helicobacter sp. T3_23-1056]
MLNLWVDGLLQNYTFKMGYLQNAGNFRLMLDTKAGNPYIGYFEGFSRI